MKCSACNAENPAAAKFCQACGVPFAMAQAITQPPAADQPGAELKSAGLRISPTVIGIVLLLLISAAGAAYVGWTWFEDSPQPVATSAADEKAIEEKRRQAEQDRLADERQKTLDAEREKQRQLADAEQAMKLAQAKSDEDRRRADDAVRGAEEQAKRAEARAREDARAAQQAQQQAKAQQESKAQQDKAQQEAKAREAKAREDARAKELARQREERAAAAREAKARQQASATSTARPVETAAPAPAPVQAAPVAVAQAPVQTAPAQNDPCAGLTGLKREQCTSCNRHSGLRKSACEDRAVDRYCETRWNQPGEPGCVDPRRR